MSGPIAVWNPEPDESVLFLVKSVTPGEYGPIVTTEWYFAVVASKDMRGTVGDREIRLPGWVWRRARKYDEEFEFKPGWWYFAVYVGEVPTKYDSPFKRGLVREVAGPGFVPAAIKWPEDPNLVVHVDEFYGLRRSIEGLRALDALLKVQKAGACADE